jgi:hypothetical protein
LFERYTDANQWVPEINLVTPKSKIPTFRVEHYDGTVKTYRDVTVDATVKYPDRATKEQYYQEVNLIPDNQGDVRLNSIIVTDEDNPDRHTAYLFAGKTREGENLYGIKAQERVVGSQHLSDQKLSDYRISDHEKRILQDIIEQLPTYPVED